jgi:two-component system, cell cycle sensor histidine kinase and response regulator CckA
VSEIVGTSLKLSVPPAGTEVAQTTNADANLNPDADERPDVHESGGGIVIPPISTSNTSTTSATSTTSSRPANGNGNKKILVVEDQFEVRSLIRRILLREGYQVQEATSGKYALELAVASDAHFDLVMTDVSMPEMSGLEFGQHLAKLYPTLPVLYTSGHSERTLSRMLISEGGTAAGTGAGQPFLLLEKPFTIAQLVSKVREVLDNLYST